MEIIKTAHCAGKSSCYLLCKTEENLSQTMNPLLDTASKMCATYKIFDQAF